MRKVRVSLATIKYDQFSREGAAQFLVGTAYNGLTLWKILHRKADGCGRVPMLPLAITVAQMELPAGKAERASWSAPAPPT